MGEEGEGVGEGGVPEEMVGGEGCEGSRVGNLGEHCSGSRLDMCRDELGTSVLLENASCSISPPFRSCVYAMSILLAGFAISNQGCRPNTCKYHLHLRARAMFIPILMLLPK